MQVFRSPEELRADVGAGRPVWLTLGGFDGVHRGHQALLARLRAEADAAEPPARAVALTFELHPRVHLNHEPVRPIVALDHKLRLLGRYGVDAALLVSFTDEIAKIDAVEFVRDWLVERIGVAGVVLGYDARFGHKARGDFALMQRLGREMGFATLQQPALKLPGGQIISSSAVRVALADADLEYARELLGRRFSLIGSVAHGRRLGRTIGFPTANLEVHREFLLPTGVYGVFVRPLDGPQLLGDGVWGVANLGYRPTVDPNNDTPTLEVHILDFDGDIYGRQIEVEFHMHLRREQKFPSVNALTAQIEADRHAFRDWLAARPG
jgi:riboflavin kinase/FMN adenylyltransferase